MLGTYTSISTGAGGQQPSAREEVEVEKNQRQFLAGQVLEVLLVPKLSLGCNVEKSDVYGVAIAMPQIARSTGWSNLTLGLALRGWLFMLLTFAIQGLFMYMMFKEQNVMERYSGQMNLCDFGADIERCHKSSDAPGCMGPAGTKYTAARLYSWSQWTDRSFVKESLMHIFPDKRDEIKEKVDPGEYGLEDYWCRLAGVFVFMVSVMQELMNLGRMLKLLWHVPSEAESWIMYNGEMESDTIPTMNDMNLRVAGIPYHWKAIYVLFIFVPRAFMWKFVAECGVCFLMESAGITEVIVNSVALGFILTIGDMIFAQFSVRATKDLMDHLRDYIGHLGGDTDGDGIPDNVEYLMNYRPAPLERLHLNVKLFPARFIGTCVITAILVFDYYHRRCVRDEDGFWISKAVHLPKSMDYSVLNALLPRFFPIEEADSAYWTMPDSPQ